MLDEQANDECTGCRIQGFRSQRSLNACAKAPQTRKITDPSVSSVNKSEPPDSLTVLRPWDVHAARHADLHPGKTYTMSPDGRIKPVEYRLMKWYTGSVIEVRDVRELARVRAEVAQLCQGFLVRGELDIPHPGAVFARRKSDHRDGVPVSLAPASHRWLPLDFDKVPNVRHLDPRRDPQRTLDWMLSLLPAAIVSRTVAWDWSSSMCVGLPGDETPRTLSLHAWIWLDVGLDEEATRTLLNRLKRHVFRRLKTEDASAPAANYIDPKLADIQQPIYVAPPRLVGLTDPFPGAARHGLRDGDGDVVCLAELDAELATAAGEADAGARTTAVGNGRVAPRRGRAPTAAAPPISIDNIVCFDAMTRLRRAQAACESARVLGGYQAACKAMFAPRAATELVKVVRSRVMRGEHDPDWRPWFEAGGIPEGQRDEWMVIICSLLARSFPRDECTPANIRAATVSVGRLIVAEAWLDREWLRYRYDGSVLKRVERAQAGERVVFAGRDTDPRYRYTAARIIESLDIGEDEMEGLALKSLSTAKCRAAVSRRQAGVQARLDDEQTRRARDAAVRQMSRDGMTNRAIARARCISASTVHGVLARAAEAEVEAANLHQSDRARSATKEEGFLERKEAYTPRSTPDVQNPNAGCAGGRPVMPPVRTCGSLAGEAAGKPPVRSAAVLLRPVRYRVPASLEVESVRKPSKPRKRSAASLARSGRRAELLEFRTQDEARERRVASMLGRPAPIPFVRRRAASPPAAPPAAMGIPAAPPERTAGHGTAPDSLAFAEAARAEGCASGNILRLPADRLRAPLPPDAFPADVSCGSAGPRATASALPAAGAPEAASPPSPTRSSGPRTFDPKQMPAFLQPGNAIPSPPPEKLSGKLTRAGLTQMYRQTIAVQRHEARQQAPREAAELPRRAAQG